MTGALPPGARPEVSARVIFAGLVLLSLSLRGPLVAVATVSSDLRTDLGMSATSVGLLTSLPVLCFGLATPGASYLIARVGIDRAALLTSFGVVAGVLVRSAGGIPTALIGTVVIGVSITIGNVAGPMIIGRDFRGHAAALTGTYTATLNIGSMLALTVTGPLAERFGWAPALAVGAVIPLLSVVAWTPIARRSAVVGGRRNDGRSAAPPSTGSPPKITASRTAAAGNDHVTPGDDATSGLRHLLRCPATWTLTLAFSGQAFAYYGLTAWLPALLADVEGMSRTAAGAASSIFQVSALIGAFGTPIIITRLGGPLPAFLVNGALWVCLPLGLLLAPGGWAIWSALAGAAQGGGFATVFTVVVLRARTLTQNRQLSSMVQTGGYTIASMGPIIVGGLHERTGGWTLSLLAVLVALVVLTLMGALSTRGVRHR